MAEQDISQIRHLLEIESQATALVEDASLEAHKRILLAKQNAEQEFNIQYSKIAQGLEQKFIQSCNSLNQIHNSNLESYKQKILKTNKNVDLFNSMLNKVLLNLR